MADPVAQVTDDSPQKDTLDDAGYRALSVLADTGAVSEEAGVILRDPSGHFAITHPMHAAEDSFSLRAHINSGWKLAGIYHTHPGQQESAQYFPAHDLDTADHLNVPSYVLFQKDGSIRKYSPGQTATSVMRFAGGYARMSRGDPVSTPSNSATPRGAGEYAQASAEPSPTRVASSQ